jgi:hypothetical protein
MHKPAVSGLSQDGLYRLEAGKTAWIVGGWLLFLGLCKGHLVLTLLNAGIVLALGWDVVYL